MTKIKKKTLSKIVNDNLSARGIEAKNIAVAGVGRPINSLICFLSRLKLANLQADKIGMIIATHEIIEYSQDMKFNF